MSTYGDITEAGRKIQHGLDAIAKALTDPHVTHRLSKSQVALFVGAMGIEGDTTGNYTIVRADKFLEWLNKNSS